eukprot:6365565-Pyramimonas_sp.AAC.1
MTRILRTVRGSSSGSRPSSELSIRAADAPDVSLSTPVTTSRRAPLQPELSTEPTVSGNRPNSELWIQQTNATDDSESVS